MSDEANETSPEVDEETRRKSVKAESYELFKKFDADGGGKLGKDEIEAYVAQQDKLWAMLSGSFGFDEDRCQEVAVRVAMELATEKKGEKAFKKGVDKRQFHRFRTMYIEDPEGNIEFFDRCIFGLFDVDGDGDLDEEELDNMLDALYQASDFVRTGQNPTLGDISLPPKSEFKKTLMESDRDGDGKFSLAEIRKYLGKLRAKTKNEEARKASEQNSYALQVAKEAEAKYIQEMERQKEEEKKKQEENWLSDCVLFDWLAGILGS